MTIDTNTVLMTLMGAITIFFAVGFIRGRLNERFNAFSVRLDNTEDSWWRENERLSSRINALERECARERGRALVEKCDKNFYNTGA
jgi:hypothetical protein